MTEITTPGKRRWLRCCIVGAPLSRVVRLLKASSATAIAAIAANFVPREVRADVTGEVVHLTASGSRFAGVVRGLKPLFREGLSQRHAERRHDPDERIPEQGQRLHAIEVGCLRLCHPGLRPIPVARIVRSDDSAAGPHGRRPHVVCGLSEQTCRRRCSRSTAFPSPTAAVRSLVWLTTPTAR